MSVGWEKPADTALFRPKNIKFYANNYARKNLRRKQGGAVTLESKGKILDPLNVDKTDEWTAQRIRLILSPLVKTTMVQRRETTRR